MKVIVNAIEIDKRVTFGINYIVHYFKVSIECNPTFVLS
jgi:hypothetical protein